MTEEQKNAIIKCRNSGLGYAAIAKDIGLTKDAMVAFCRRNGLTGSMAGKAQDTTGRCRDFGYITSRKTLDIIPFQSDIWQRKE